MVRAPREGLYTGGQALLAVRRAGELFLLSAARRLSKPFAAALMNRHNKDKPTLRCRRAPTYLCGQPDAQSDVLGRCRTKNMQNMDENSSDIGIKSLLVFSVQNSLLGTKICYLSIVARVMQTRMHVHHGYRSIAVSIFRFASW